MKTVDAFVTFLAVVLAVGVLQHVFGVSLSAPALIALSVAINIFAVISLRCGLLRFSSYYSSLSSSLWTVVAMRVWASLKRLRPFSSSTDAEELPLSTLSSSPTHKHARTHTHTCTERCSLTLCCSLHSLLCVLAHNLRYVCVCLFLLILALRAYTAWQTSLSLRHAVQDLLVNQELLSPAPQSLFSDKFAIPGRAEMAQSDVTIVGVARDVADALPRLLPQIDALSQSFAYSQALFVEGDSADHSLALLQQWAARSPQNRTILHTTARGLRESLLLSTASNHSESESESGKTLRVSSSSSSSSLPLPREGRLALARNLALRAVRALPRRTKYLLVLDLDIIGFNPVGLQDSFGRHSEWDAICANGVLLHGVYRDTYAFRARGIDTNHHQGGDDHLRYNISEEQRKENRKRVYKSKAKIKSMMSEQRFIDDNIAPQPLLVDSCFGGMVVYRTDTIESCEYSHREKTAPYMLDCEHVFFHQCIRETNHAKIFSNPNMKLWYGHSNLRNLRWKQLLPSSH